MYNDECCPRPCVVESEDGSEHCTNCGEVWSPPTDDVTEIESTPIKRITLAQQRCISAIDAYDRLVLRGDRQDVGRESAVGKLKMSREHIDEAITQLEGDQDK